MEGNKQPLPSTVTDAVNDAIADLYAALPPPPAVLPGTDYSQLSSSQLWSAALRTLALLPTDQARPSPMVELTCAIIAWASATGAHSQTSASGAQEKTL